MTGADVLVVGAGPAGAAAATWLARGGREVTLLDAAEFPRDKPCGDGLTPRAVAELRLLGLDRWLAARPVNFGLRAAGFGQELYLPWPGGRLPATGSAVARTELDTTIRAVALTAGATAATGRAVDVTRDPNGAVTGVVVNRGRGEHAVLSCRTLIVADGARGQLGRALGRQWHRDTAYGVAIRGYVKTPRGDDPWISSHLELRGVAGELLSGYGWVFPLGAGQANIGVGTLATAHRPADVNLRRLLDHYVALRRDDWQVDGGVAAPASALLPMGGAVSGVAGPNWVLIGDAAGCVNPLNGEGIDYGLETGRLAAELLLDTPLRAGGLGLISSPATAWPAELRRQYGSAFSIARRLAGLLTVPHLLPAAGPVGMRSRRLMLLALRVMGNLVTDGDRDALARVWRTAGRASLRLDARPPFS